MASKTVTKYYYGVTCTNKPVHVDFSPGVCSSDKCEKNEESSYSSKCFNSTLDANERLSAAQDIIGDAAILLIDRYTDTACLEYYFSSAYHADGECYNNFEDGGITANVTEDGATYRSFDSNSTCNGSPSFSETVDLEALNEHTCTEANDNWIRAYAATTTSLSGSTSGSTDTSFGSTDTSFGSTESTGSSTSISASGSTASSGKETNSESSSVSEDAVASSPLLSTGAIIGIVAGIVLVILIAVGVGVCCVRARRRATRTDLDLTESRSHLWNDETIVASRIPRENVVLGTLLSRGAYGEVYKGWIDSRPVAIKMLPQFSRRDLQLVNSFLTEAKLMATLDHPNIVHFIGVAWSSLADLCVVSELADNGDLRSLLDSYVINDHPPGFDYNKIKIALHVAHALTYLHSLQPMVLHRDLKSRNIVLTNNMDAKLTDFGVSRERSDATMTAGVGTSLWMAPEVLLGHRYDDRADVFSFGVVLSELDVHTLPYANAKSSQSGHKLSDTAILQMVSMGSLRVQFSENTMPMMEDLGLACVATDPAARPSAAEVLHRLQMCLKSC